MLAVFFAWWWRQIVSLAPQSLVSGRPDAVIYEIEGFDDESRGLVYVRQGGRERLFGPLNALPALVPALPASLRLPDDQVLCREVSLPIEALGDIAPFLSFEMDRLTPFSADEVVWGVNGFQRDVPARRVTLNLLVAVREQVERLAALVSRPGLPAPAFVECHAGWISLNPAGGRRRWRLWGLWALCGVLALACGLILFERQQVALDSARAAIAEVQGQAREAVGLRARLGFVASGEAAIAAARAGGGTLESLAALTDALPDGTWLSDITLKGGELSIDGESTQAARLIGVLAAVPAFHDPRFVAPVTRAISGNFDMFSIRLEVSP